MSKVQEKDVFEAIAPQWRLQLLLSQLHELLAIPPPRPVRQPAVPQQVAHLLEAGLRRQVVDVVPPIREDAAIAVDEADARRGRDDVLEAGL